ncbi:MFS transporter [Frondihabitans australicus]|uniref:Putative MFS family arabinose efflux permease n=1 Tax=Frondihabitans australicus TaxID=386892 RepID=A0A495IBX4_9MICO|nr:MFS transporter [Frondihabitans australicus]RKR72988.1 putative MFS family arabinose efflux permease [Frondihabitans australicus]
MSTATTTSGVTDGPIRSLVPARMDRLPWTRFHWTVILGLGISWVLDGLEIEIVASNGFAQEFHMSSGLIGNLGTTYLIGQVFGAIIFGRLSDRLGRKRLFILTLVIYLVGSGVAGLSPAVWFLFVFRFIAGMGIGGEYAAINSAIDELIPSKYRGHVDIAVNGTYWGGAALGAVANIFFLNHSLFAVNVGWRLAFFIGPVIGIGIIWLRRNIPESPRWYMTHGYEQRAEDTVAEIEARVQSEGGTLEPVDDSQAIEVKRTDSIPFRQIWRVLWLKYPKRTVTGLAMMITQSFLYNAIFFSYALVLENFYHTSSSSTQYYFFPFAIGNLIGPLVLGRLFDTIGRRKMIFATYLLAGIVLAVSAVLFQAGVLNATTQTIFWCVAFFFASAGASSAYLTVSEIFPLEMRSQVISYFFAIGQIVGAIAPSLFGALVGDGSSRGPLTIGYFLGAGVMILGGVIAFVLGVDAERKSLEAITEPLSLVKR